MKKDNKHAFILSLGLFLLILDITISLVGFQERILLYDRKKILDVPYIRDAPEKIEINQLLITFSCYLMRNYGPPVLEPPPMICAIKLKSNNDSEIFSQIIFTDIWVINENQIWYEKLTLIDLLLGEYRIETNSLTIVIRNGPTSDYWTGERKIDVIFRFYFNSNCFIGKIPKQPIHYPS